MPFDHATPGARLLLTIGLVACTLVAGGLIRAAAGAALRGSHADRPRFWIAQIVRLITVGAIVAGVAALWAREIPQVAAVGGWIAAGLAVALQRVVTAFAGYIIVLRGKIFTVGDRITIGGVRGDVVALGFMQTTVMEMGQAPGEKSDDPAMWVRGRQYSGRLVRITNDKVFDTPIYNYTRDFPFLWEEITLPVSYGSDYRTAEHILLAAAAKHTAAISAEARARIADFQEKYFLGEEPEVDPRVYLRLTDNWIELSLRFMGRDHGIRGLKDGMYRDILAALDEAHFGVASTTFAITELPAVRVSLTPPGR
jgi:small-conductance mechanosensitive channel